MNSTKLLRYSMQLSMLKQLSSSKNLINETEYQRNTEKTNERLWYHFQYYCLTSTESAL